MRFSLKWLLELCPLDPAARAPAAIAERLTARGLTVDALEGAGAEDHALDVDIPANRPDCLGHLGLAREIAAAWGVRLPEPPRLASGGAEAEWGTVRIAPGVGCARYTANLVRGVKVGPSPGWVVERLEACGLRSVNNVVDASNLVLLGLGHPVHFFDRDKLGRGRPIAIEVREARDGEALEVLGGTRCTLAPPALLITESGRPVALAGIIGGAETGIDDATREVLVEAASFDPLSIRATARSSGLATDASFRFARGVDAASAPAAQALSARLLAELAGGQALATIADTGKPAVPPAELMLDAAELGRLLGHVPDDQRVVSALEAVGLAPEAAGARRWRVRIPSWRIDLEREADLVEEVARHHGYDEIPSHGPALVAAGDREPATEPVRDLLAHLGFHEAFGYSMIGAGEDDRFVHQDEKPAIALTNPIAEPMARMRRSILPGLLRALEGNVRRGARDVRLFEVGRVFLAQDGTWPREPLHAAIVWCGSAEPRHWSRPARSVDLHDLTGLAARALAILTKEAFERREVGRSAFHPGVAFCWSMDGSDCAWGGALHPEIAERLGVQAFALELRVDGYPPPAVPRYEPVGRFPAVSRDLAVVVAAGRAFGEVLERLAALPAPAPVEFEVIDRYEGAPLAPGEASLTVRFTLAPRERTLTDAETEAYRGRVTEELHRLGLRLRD